MLKVGDKNVVKLAYGSDAYEPAIIGKYLLVQLPSGANAMSIARLDNYVTGSMEYSTIYNGEKYPIVGMANFSDNASNSPSIIIKKNNSFWVASPIGLSGTVVDSL